MSLYTTLRPALFLLPPEKAHRAAICALQRGLVPAYRSHHASLKTTVAGLTFDNPVGLAPGFDKNAECFEGALAAGFGFVEIGTVTPRAQPGNPAPRVFRLVEQEAIINRLGFNNEGMDAAARRLALYRATATGRHPGRRPGISSSNSDADYGPEIPGHSEQSGERRSQPRDDGCARGILGGNVGKNKDSADAIADYVSAMRALYPHVDYITANISSPNTPGLRALQAADELKALIEALQKLREELIAGGASRKPLFVKIAPDGEDSLFEAIADIARATKLDGLIISNTTLARDAVSGSPHANETGGLSGKPLFALSTTRLKKMYQLTRGEVPLIGVGGIASAEDAYAKIRAGASLVQLYTALVYQGFGLVREINEGLAKLLTQDGFIRVSDAVGVDT